MGDKREGRVTSKTQEQDVTQAWAEAQRRLWDNWLGSMRQVGGSVPTAPGASPAQLWGHMLDTWEPFVRQTLDAQSTAMQAWVDGLATAPGTPEPLKGQIVQLQELARGWISTQRQMWDATFQATRQFVSASATQPGFPSAQAGPDMWRQFAAPVFEAQASWVRQWSDMLSGPRTGGGADRRGG
jgi:hypothetical protein